MFRWKPADAGGFELSRVVSFDWGILVISLRVRGEFVLVGDLMKSICLLRFNAEAQTLTEVRCRLRNSRPAVTSMLTWRTCNADGLSENSIMSTACPRQERLVDHRGRAL